MALSTLTAISPIDGRYESKVQMLQSLLSEFGLMKYRLYIEISWLIALSDETAIKECAPIQKDDREFLIDLFEQFSPVDAEHIKKIESTTNHDVKAVEYFLKEKCLKRANLIPYFEFIHFACTSEDINNLAYACLLKNSRETCLLPAMSMVIDTLKKMAVNYSRVPMLARTHGQPASPTTVGKEFANVVNRLNAQIDLFKKTSIKGKINGAVGNFNAHVIAYPEIDWLHFSKSFVEELGIEWNAYTTQIEPHDYISELFDTLARFNTILIDFCRDTWGYISLGYFQQKKIENEVGSSTMPHKINPIDFENAEGNLELANNTLRFLGTRLMTSRWQRDLVDSTLLRNLGVGIAHSIIAYQSLLKGLNKLSIDEKILSHDLNNHWEILGEAIQTVMRRYGIEKPYEQLKTLTRGKHLNMADLHQFIKNSELPSEPKQKLLALTPENYLGLAIDLAEKV
jgi:adenylosuccinate lyase